MYMYSQAFTANMKRCELIGWVECTYGAKITTALLVVNGRPIMLLFTAVFELQLKVHVILITD